MDIDANIPEESGKKRVVIIGAGFGGIALAKRLLKRSDLQIILVDRNNHHTFQPLLYQVATGGLEASSIAYPVRRIFHGYSNFFFRMAEVQGVEADKRLVHTNVGDIHYDYLVLATGSKTNFFNFEAKDMLAMKTVAEALDLRSYILQNFEQAVLHQEVKEQDHLLNIVIVGGGPTGIELAGALAEMRRYILPKEYPELKTEIMDIFLFERSSRLLEAMSPDASEKSKLYLEAMGVKVLLNTAVERYADGQVHYGQGQTIAADTLIWTAGVKGALVEGMGAQALAGNRFKVNTFNQIEGHENIFAIGDVAAMITEELPRGHPMLAPVAMQQAWHLADNILRLEKKQPLKPFVYRNKGSMATIGRNRAVVDLPRWKTQGFFAWFIWMFVHVMSLVGFRNKLVVFVDWMVNYFTYDRAMRLIIRPFRRKD